jgi:hypothetical protein
MEFVPTIMEKAGMVLAASFPEVRAAAADRVHAEDLL